MNTTALNPTPLRTRLTSLLIFAVLTALAPLVLAQAPAEDARQRQDAILRGQHKAGSAHRDLQQAERARKRAEQRAQRADADYKATQKRADELKRQAEIADKNLDSAKAQEAQARKSYDGAVDAVDQTWHKPVQK